MIEGSFRNENKYLITEPQRFLIETRLRPLLRLDRHIVDGGGYNIRSLYFDDLQNTCFYENEIGVDPREKYRLRIYNADAENVHFEIKRKIHGKTKKELTELNKEQALTYADNLRKRKGFYPSVITSYDRIAYVYPVGNVRITIDYNICASNDFSHFFDKEILKIPILEPGNAILEIKWDQFFPDFLTKVFTSADLQRTAFSKYYMCKSIFM